MLKSHLKIALRYLKNHRTYSAINITGLTLGFLCFLMLNAYIASEQNFDRQHGNVYRIIQQVPGEDGNLREIAPIGPQVGYASRQQFPEIEAVTEGTGLGRITVGNEPGNRNYERITTIDEDFFKVFNFEMIEGSPEQLFSQPNGILLTRTIKEKYFGSAPALGQTLRTQSADAVVAAVMEDFPSNTHLDGGLMLPSQTTAAFYNFWENFVQNNWDRNSLITYLKLRTDADVASLEKKITRLAAENWPQDKEFNSTFVLQPVQDIHLYPGNVEGEINKSKGNGFYIDLFFWIALVILLVACFNYTGLLNVAFMGRSREIGVRKVMGAERRQLLWQFLSESLLLTSFSMLLAWLILHYAQPLLPGLFGPAFDLTAIPLDKVMIIALAGLVISLVSISYPTYLISRLAIIEALKEVYQGNKRVPFRKVMTVFQFVAAIALIACTSVLYQQIRYLQKKELGFDLKGLVTVDINSRVLRSRFEAIKEEFAKLPEVQAVTVSSRVPGEWKRFPLADVLRPGEEIAEAREMIFLAADADFLQTYEAELAAGNNFTGGPSDSTKVLLNASAVQALGLQEPVGQWIEVPQVNWSGDVVSLQEPLRVQVAGVVDDFHFEDFRQAIRPMMIGYWRNPIHNIDYYTLRVQTSDWSNTIAALRRVNDRFDANNPLEFNILNDRFQRFYEADVLRSRLLFFFAGVVIFIACLGLLAMTAFTLRKRTKEIGIRKVLGATSGQIVSLITRDFLRLILAGFAIAVPISWLVMNRWLDEFAFPHRYALVDLWGRGRCSVVDRFSDHRHAKPACRYGEPGQCAQK